jgi:cobalt-zinc-cadmium efflux system membrane fusion protein
VTHTLSFSRRLAVLALSAALFNACSDAPAADAAPERAGGVITLFTDSTELFMEHPALIVGVEGKFAAHLTDLTDFAPLRSGRIVLTFTPRSGGAPLVVTQEAPRVAGIYGPAPVFTAPGIYDLVIDVDSPQAKDRIEVPGLVVYATEEDAPLDESEDAGIPFLKEQQWKTAGFRTDFAVSGSVAIAVNVPGEIVPAPGASQVAAAPASGLLELVESAPAVGMRVRRGDVLARVRPTLGEGGASFADARARLREAEEEHARAERLLRAEAIPERRMHEATVALDAAREALAAIGGGSVTADGLLEVRSPIDGVVVQRWGTAGARVEAGTPLFSIVNPQRLWITAFVPVDVVSRVDRNARAAVTPEGFTDAAFTARPLGVSAAVDSLTRAVRVSYAIDGLREGIPVGTLARVAVPTRTRGTGVVVPASAVLEEDGNYIVFVQTSGERYERRLVQVDGGDGRRTLVRSGLVAGDRVVSGAAYQVKLASLSTAVPTHGHEH